MWKLFITTDEPDFSNLVQSGTRGLRDSGAEGDLYQLLERALSDRGTRDARRRRGPNQDRWSTEQVAFCPNGRRSGLLGRFVFHVF